MIKVVHNGTSTERVLSELLSEIRKTLHKKCRMNQPEDAYNPRVNATHDTVHTSVRLCYKYTPVYLYIYIIYYSILYIQ